MREDIRAWVAAVSQVLPLLEPIVEIGAYQVPGQEGLADLRSLFPGKEYLGCDIVSGPGVDRIEDLHQLSFKEGSVGTFIAVETLEHVADPYVATREIERVLRPGGVAIITTPFNFPIHHMPDYTRFTPEGMAHLLEGFAAQAVFAQGDAQHPHSVCALACKRGSGTDDVGLEMLAVRLQNAWNLHTLHDPLVRFEPLFGVVRWDTPQRDLGGLTQGRTIEQGFVCPRDWLARIDLKLSLLGVRSNGQLRLDVWDDNDSVQATVETPARYVWHDRWIAFQFPALAHSAGRRLRFRLTCSDPQATVTALASTNDRLPDTALTVDGTPQAGSLCFEALCQRNEAPHPPGDRALPNARSAAPAADTLAAARVQAAELHYATALLHAEIEHLRRELADLSARVDRISTGVVDELAATLRRYWPVRVVLGLLGGSRNERWGHTAGEEPMSYKLCLPGSLSAIEWSQAVWKVAGDTLELDLCEKELLHDVLLQHLPQDALILDAGCGTGRWPIYLRRRGYRTLGVEIGFDGARLARRFEPGFDVIQADVWKMPLKSNSVDVVLSLGVVEHHEDGPLDALRETRRILKTGGMLILAVPYNNCFRRVLVNPLQEYTNRRWRRAHAQVRFNEYRFTRREVHAFLDSTGFSVVGAYPNDLRPPLTVGLWVDYNNVTFNPLVDRGGAPFVLQGLKGVLGRNALRWFPWLVCAEIVFVARAR